MANIALPGTSSFIGEFLLLAGIYKSNVTIAVISALGVILSGAYSLWLYNRIIFGNIKVNYTLKFSDISSREFYIMLPLLFFVFFMGLFPNYFLAYLHVVSNSVYLITF